MRSFMAIDPGKNGGIAWSINGNAFCEKMGQTPGEIWEQITDIKAKAMIRNAPIAFCALEVVHSMPGQGIASAWTFAEGYGLLKGILMCEGIPVQPWQPLAWQKAIGAARPSTKDMNDQQKAKVKAEAKRKIKEIVEAAFPYLVQTKSITLATADALGILLAAGKTQPLGEQNG